jgi:hypothetical protein
LVDQRDESPAFSRRVADASVGVTDHRAMTVHLHARHWIHATTADRLRERGTYPCRMAILNTALAKKHGWSEIAAHVTPSRKNLDRRAGQRGTRNDAANGASSEGSRERREEPASLRVKK